MNNKDKIRQIALDSGFKLKNQPNGEMDLNPYVYDFATALINNFILIDRSIWEGRIDEHIKCWSCYQLVSLKDRAENDGFCTNCNAEIEASGND